MAELTEKKRDSMKSSQYGLPEERKYPMPDKSHARNAKARASQPGHTLACNVHEAGAVNVCELRKMYFLPEARGRGAGAALLQRCLVAARSFGFTTCYLETLARMDGAPPLSSQIAEAKAVGAAVWHREGDSLAVVQRERPALPKITFSCCKLPTWPMVA